jgi:ABC-type lipoprotein export system ATPase subunit/histidinol phosphatase-like PHP family hydrolase
VNDPKGSRWRKWDLHFHTPSSYDYKDKSLTDQQLIDTLKQYRIGVVAITDHHVMDVARIRNLQSLAGDSLTVLPGIELRSELGGGQSVHFIGIFPEDCNLERLWTQLHVKLGIGPEDVKEKGDERIYCDLKDSARAIHDLGGVVTVHAGHKSNSIESIKNVEKFKQALKADLVKSSIDIYEVGNPADIQQYRDKVFPYVGVLPLIIGSDSHDVKTYTFPSPCWVKADPTFKGLLQVLQEPEDRLYIGTEPDKVKLVRENPTRFISGLDIQKKPGAALTEEWFGNVELPLNHDLVAIIGNKGSGKSALADIIGLLGGSKLESNFSFLNSNKFRNPKGNKSRSFQATLKWESGTSTTKGLDENIDLQQVQAIRYLPQSYLELLCNEIGGTEENTFDRELEKVIYSHVPVEDRLGHPSLRDLIQYRTEQLQASTEMLRVELSKVNADLAVLERQGRPDYMATLKSMVLAKEEELKAHLQLEPEPVEEPKNLDPELLKLAVELEVKAELLKKRNKEVEQAKNERNRQFRLLAAVQRLDERIANFERQFEMFLQECAEEASLVGIQVQDFVMLTVDRGPLTGKRTGIEQVIAEVSKDLDPAYQDGATYQIAQLEKELQALQAKLDEPNSKYQQYKEAHSRWEQRKGEIVGTPSVPESLSYYQAEVEALAELPQKVETLRNHRLEITREIHRTLLKVVDVYRELYQPVQLFIKDHPLVKNKFKLNFEVSLVDTGFVEGFLNHINHGVTGSFAGIAEGKLLVSSLKQKYDFSNEEQAITFVLDIVDHLTSDKRAEKPRKVEITSQLRKGFTTEALHDFVFSLGYLSPRYLLKLGDSLPGQLSPGEKGTLLLIFYLLLDSDNIPLIIDQPEENLDNQTVYDLLVPCIKEAKKRRQVIIVTHNPNLAVVCDAEQIIHASLEKFQKYRLTYSSGAIEKPDINRHLLDVLEGTFPAFQNRGSKYLPHQGRLLG